jgi:hypothetical protein
MFVLVEPGVEQERLEAHVVHLRADSRLYLDAFANAFDSELAMRQHLKIERSSRDSYQGAASAVPQADQERTRLQPPHLDDGQRQEA